MRAQAEVARLIQTHGVILRRDHPELDDALDRLLAAGKVAAVLPGVLVAAGTENQPDVRIHAASRWEPDAVFTREAAARLSYWPGVRLDRIDVAAGRRHRPQPGFSFSRRRIPAELVVERDGLRFTNPSLTALDLSDLDHTDAIDTALRTRVATLQTLHEALRLTSRRRGNADRRRVLVDSRDEPWSRAERESHRLLHRAGISGWQANVPFRAAGSLYYLDIAFRRVRLAIEIDGRFHEDDVDQFESDRWRQNALVSAGWRVLRFTWAMLIDHPDYVIEMVRRSL